MQLRSRGAAAATSTEQQHHNCFSRAAGAHRVDRAGQDLAISVAAPALVGASTWHEPPGSCTVDRLLPRCTVHVHPSSMMCWNSWMQLGHLWGMCTVVPTRFRLAHPVCINVGRLPCTDPLVVPGGLQPLRRLPRTVGVVAPCERRCIRHCPRQGSCAATAAAPSGRTQTEGPMFRGYRVPPPRPIAKAELEPELEPRFRDSDGPRLQQRARSPTRATPIVRATLQGSNLNGMLRGNA